MVRAFDAHVLEIKGASMKVKVHGGSTITTKTLDKARLFSELVVIMEPGARTAVEVLNVEDWKKRVNPHESFYAPREEVHKPEDYEGQNPFITKGDYEMKRSRCPQCGELVEACEEGGTFLPDARSWQHESTILYYECEECGCQFKVDAGKRKSLVNERMFMESEPTLDDALTFQEVMNEGGRLYHDKAWGCEDELWE